MSFVGPQRGGYQPPKKPLDAGTSAGVRMVGAQLRGTEYGPFDGAFVETPLNAAASEAEDQAAQERLVDNVRRLIKNGQVRYNPKGYEMKIPQDYFDAHGKAFIGITVWKGDEMHIQRLPVAT